MNQLKIKEEAIAVLKINTKTHDNFIYTTPSHETYPYQWLWDSCFHAIAFSHFDPKRGQAELRSLISAQFKNGLIPHMIYWERGKLIDIDWGLDRKRSTITQPPMLAYAAWQLFEQGDDLDFLNEIYPKLFHFYKYLITERDPHERGLVGLINPDESGEDNSPRFDRLLDLPPQHSLAENLKKRIKLVKENKQCNFDAPFCMKNFFWVKDVPFNSIMIKNLESLVNIALKLGRAYDAEYFSRVRGRMIKSMRDLMSEDGLFWPTYGEHYEKIKVKTWAIFAPLFAGFLSQTEAQNLVQNHLLNKKEFWTNYPVPSVAINEPSFNESEMWRGGVWGAVNWFIYQGLKHYGFSEALIAIKKSMIALIEKSGFREYYSPHTGTGYGAVDFTWGALILDLEL